MTVNRHCLTHGNTKMEDIRKLMPAKMAPLISRNAISAVSLILALTFRDAIKSICDMLIKTLQLSDRFKIVFQIMFSLILLYVLLVFLEEEEEGN